MANHIAGTMELGVALGGTVAATSGVPTSVGVATMAGGATFHAITIGTAIIRARNIQRRVPGFRLMRQVAQVPEGRLMAVAPVGRIAPKLTPRPRSDFRPASRAFGTGSSSASRS
jgi:hypothetical protein